MTRFRSLLMLMVLALITAACSDAESASGSEAIAPTYGTVSVDGAGLPPFDPSLEAASGSPVPGFSTQNLSGEPITFQPGESPTVLVFLAHWCSHCQAELPRLVSWLEANPQDTVDVLAVATSINPGQPNFPPANWFEREEWTEPVALDSEGSDIAQAYGLGSFPFWAVVDAEGNLIGRTAGEIDEQGFAALFGLAAG